MHRRAPLVSGLICAVSGSAALALTPSASIASLPTTYEPLTAAQTATLTASERALLTSDQPKTIVMDPQTGDILSVTRGTANVVSPAIQNHNICNSGDGCYHTNHPPYADQGFYGGSGTFHGNWPYRSGYYSGKWTASACSTVRCYAKLPPYTAVGFTSDVTGTSFTIY